MNKKNTPTHLRLAEGKRPLPDKHFRPSEQTLAFIRSFARNYYVEPQLPQGLQGIILG